EATGNHSDALAALKWARQLGIWFHRTYGKEPNFSPGPFVNPTEQPDATDALQQEIAALRARVARTEEAAARAKAEVDAHAVARNSAEERSKKEIEDRQVWEQLAKEAEAEKLRLIAMVSGSSLPDFASVQSERPSRSVTSRLHGETTKDDETRLGQLQ